MRAITVADAGLAFVVFLAVLAFCCWLADTLDRRYQRYIDLQRFRLSRTDREDAR